MRKNKNKPNNCYVQTQFGNLLTDFFVVVDLKTICQQ